MRKPNLTPDNLFQPFEGNSDTPREVYQTAEHIPLLDQYLSTDETSPMENYAAGLAPF